MSSRRAPPGRRSAPTRRGRGPPIRRGPPSRRGPPTRRGPPSRTGPPRRGPPAVKARSNNRSAPFVPSRTNPSVRRTSRGVTASRRAPAIKSTSGRSSVKTATRSAPGKVRAARSQASRNAPQIPVRQTKPSRRGASVTSRKVAANPSRRGGPAVRRGPTRRGPPGRSSVGRRRGPTRRGPIRAAVAQVNADRFKFIDDSKLPPVPEYRNVNKVYIQGNAQSICPKMPGGGIPISQLESNKTRGPPSAPGASKSGPPVPHRGPMSMPNMNAGPPPPNPSSPTRTISRGAPMRAPTTRKAPSRGSKPPSRGSKPPSRAKVSTVPSRGRKAPFQPVTKSSTKSSEGKDDIQAQIAELEKEKQQCLANEDYERCAAIKKQINALKAASAGPTFDEAAYNAALKKLETQKKTHLANEEFEKCAEIRDKKMALQNIKKEWDTSGGSKKLEAKMKKCIAGI